MRSSHLFPGCTAIRYQVGNGTYIGFSSFPWLDNGPIADRFQSGIRMKTGLPMQSMVSDVISEGRRSLPAARDYDVARLWKEVADVELPPRIVPDWVVWTLNADGFPLSLHGF